ncbi:MAG: M48 family metalloprotease, partial [Candidatus Obscuribacterales bacterium]|nr:M48 family metalloprotease [Candidatus Obscuribacterales bacterium]
FALVIASFSVFTFLSHSDFNPITEKKQHLSLSPQEEIGLGLKSAPEMVQQYGGEASTDVSGETKVRETGDEIVAKSAASKTPYKFNFHLLADNKTVNAFALPGGQVFITEGLYKLLSTRGQLAGVLGHEIGHVVARHSAQQIAKQELTQGLTGAAVIATYDPNDRNSANTAAVAAMIGSVVNMKFGRTDELEADKLGVRFLSEAGYDPNDMIKVMEILQKVGTTRTPEFFSTHPNPDHRIQQIKKEVEQRYPNGIPAGMRK